MIGWLRVELGHLVTCQQAADLIERLAARVPAGCVVVPKSALAWLFGEEGEFECPPDKYFRGKAPAYWWRSKFRELIAAGEVK